jgi:hypothetical protein
MIGALFSSLVQMGGAYGALHFKRFKQKLFLSLLSAAIFSLFAVLALIFLCVIMFIALAENYGPMTAAVTLFGLAFMLCLVTVLVHLIARRLRTAEPDNSLVNGLKAQLPSTLALGMALGRQTRNLFTPKKIAVAALLAVGAVLVSRPVTTYRLVKNLVHKDVEKVERQPFWRRYFK